MNFLQGAALNKPLNRCQFGKVAGGAAVLLAGVTYGAVTIVEGSAKTTVRTTFGKVSIISVSRLPRLNAQGHSPAINHMTAGSIFRGRGTPDSGRIRGSAASAPSGGHGHGHGDALLNTAWPQPINFTKGDVLVLEADIYNESQEPALLSPAQLRLKPARSGTTITPKDFDRIPGMLDANARERIRISYFTPHPLNTFELEFSDRAHERVLRLAMPPVTTMEVLS